MFHFRDRLLVPEPAFSSLQSRRSVPFPEPAFSCTSRAGISLSPHVPVLLPVRSGDAKVEHVDGAVLGRQTHREVVPLDVAVMPGIRWPEPEPRNIRSQESDLDDE